jgi:hypothetical protein
MSTSSPESRSAGVIAADRMDGAAADGGGAESEMLTRKCLRISGNL